jgi:hypothetical protein
MNSKKIFKVADVVKFVPYYAASGMQGAMLKLKMPDYDCLGLVTKIFDIQVVLMLAAGSIKSFHNSYIETIITLETVH